MPKKQCTAQITVKIIPTDNSKPTLAALLQQLLLQQDGAAGNSPWGQNAN